MKRYIALLLVVLMTAVPLAGCIVPEITNDTIVNPEDPIELIIILGTHENAWLSLDDLCNNGVDQEEFAELIYRTMDYYEENRNHTVKFYLKVIVCDKDPAEVTLLKKNGQPLELSKSNRNIHSLTSFPEELAEDVAEALQNEKMLADDPEVDLIKALLKASNMFETDGREHMIYIMDTGLCTAGSLNFQEFAWDTLPYKDIMLRIPEGEFADLEGVQVEFRNLGDVCGTQEELIDEKQIHALEVMWREYLVRCGVETPVVEFNSNEFNASQDQAAYNAINFQHTVTPITLNQGTLPPPPPPSNAPFDPVLDANLVLNDDSVGGFDANSFVPNDEQKARTLAAEKKLLLEDIQREYPDTIFYVIGSCSYRKGKPYDTHPDARKRAETIAQYLIDAGVPKELIKIVDAGTNVLPWRNADEKTEKEKNQVVAIIPSYRVEIIRQLISVLDDDQITLPAEASET